MIYFLGSIKFTGTDSHKCNSVSVRLVHIGLNLEDKTCEGLFRGLNPAYAAVTGLGFAWKSGIAAEVICRTQGSLGDLLWGGKATISYDQVFALAAVIVLCSALLQSAALGLTRKEGGHDPV